MDFSRFSSFDQSGGGSKAAVMEHLSEAIALEAEVFTANEVIKYLESMRTPLIAVPPAFSEIPPEAPPVPLLPDEPQNEPQKSSCISTIEDLAGNIVGKLGRKLDLLEYESAYEAAQRKYEEQIRKDGEDYRRRCRKTIDDYEKRKRIYNEKRNECIVYNHIAYRANGAIGQAQQLLAEGRNKLLELLGILYAMGIVYPKYRNWVAVSSFYEYLESGRCDELTGTNGAYNIYEAESRADIIIHKLDVVIKNLSQIAATQHKLYVEMVKANRNIRALAAHIDMGLQSIRAQVSAQTKRIESLAFDVAEMGAGLENDLEQGFLQMDGYMRRLDKASERTEKYLREMR